MIEKIKENAFNWISENESLIIDVNNKIWEYAELGLQEFKSSKLLIETLEEYGFNVERGVAELPTAFVATWGSGKPIIGIQGEYDAIPGVSQKAVPYREPLKEGAPGHGCGHNLYAASGLGGVIATKIAMEAKQIPGTVKFFGTPAEETYAGKTFMVRDGVYNGVDAVLYHHIGTGYMANIGSGSALNSVYFMFYGKTAHAGSTPWQGRSALHAVELMDIGVHMMREHIIRNATVNNVIKWGGSMPEQIPGKAISWYTIKAPTREILQPIYDWVCEIAEGAAKMTQTSVEIKLRGAITHSLRNKTLAELIVKNMREIGTPIYTEEELTFARRIGEQIPREEKMTAAYQAPNWEELMDVNLNTKIYDPRESPITSYRSHGIGSSDSSDVSWIAPLCSFNTGTRILGAPGHSWMNVAVAGMSIGHKNAIFASKVLASTALDLFTKPEILKEAWKEFEKKKGGREYKSPLPPDLKPPIDQFASYDFRKI